MIAWSFPSLLPCLGLVVATPHIWEIHGYQHGGVGGGGGCPLRAAKLGGQGALPVTCTGKHPIKRGAGLPAPRPCMGSIFWRQSVLCPPASTFSPFSTIGMLHSQLGQQLQLPWSSRAAPAFSVVSSVDGSSLAVSSLGLKCRCQVIATQLVALGEGKVEMVLQVQEAIYDFAWTKNTTKGEGANSGGSVTPGHMCLLQCG